MRTTGGGQHHHVHGKHNQAGSIIETHLKNEQFLLNETCAQKVLNANGTEGEFAIMLADSWQGKRIGTALLKSCLAFSKRYGLKRVFGVVLRENKLPHGYPIMPTCFHSAASTSLPTRTIEWEATKFEIELATEEASK